MIKWKKVVFGLVMLPFIFAALPISAQTTGGSPTTGGQEGPATGQVLTTICAACLFPISIGGTPDGNAMNVPADADKTGVCICKWIGPIPVPGVTYGMWIPQRIIETVRGPYYSPTLGTSMAGSGASSVLNSALRGGPGSLETGTNKIGFSNMHIFMYPIGTMINSMLSTACVSSESGGADLAYVSEIDPSWNDDSISLIMTPEASIFANQPASMACMADSAAADVYQPLDYMFWCMGSWGTAYPQNGETATTEPPRQAAFAAAKALAMMQRRGLIFKTMGADAVCSSYPEPVFTKTQYKLEQLWPNPEAVSDHWIGEDPNIWGEFRYIPFMGEDFVNLVFQWTDCCVL